MSIRNKVFSSKNIEDILGEGYVACKDCKPDRDALYIINKEINEFETNVSEVVDKINTDIYNS